jgi:hypothetical protein
MAQFGKRNFHRAEGNLGQYFLHRNRNEAIADIGLADELHQVGRQAINDGPKGHGYVRGSIRRNDDGTGRWFRAAGTRRGGARSRG